jgi:hypothetical protein
MRIPLTALDPLSPKLEALLSRIIIAMLFSWLHPHQNPHIKEQNARQKSKRNKVDNYIRLVDKHGTLS